MPPFVFALVALSASMHVLWNARVKTCCDSAAFAWLTTMVSIALLLPIFIFSRM